MRILVIRFSSIGDVLLTTPVLRVLSRAGHEVHFVTKSGMVPLLKTNPHVDRIWPLETYPSLKALCQALKTQRFDYVADLHGNLRSFLVRLQLWPIRTRGYDKCVWPRWIRVWTKRWGRCRHVVERYFDAIQPLGLGPDGQGLTLVVPPEAYTVLDHLPPSHRNGYYSIVLGARHVTKQIPPHRIAYLLDRVRYPTVLIGGPAEQALGEKLATSRPHVVNMAGKANLLESTALIQRSRLVVTPDTGMMHVAAALRRPMLVLWGSTVPEFGFTPYVPDGAVPVYQYEVRGLNCRPCSRHGRPRCPKGHFACMERHPWTQIANQIRWLIESSVP